MLVVIIKDFEWDLTNSLLLCCDSDWLSMYVFLIHLIKLDWSCIGWLTVWRRFLVISFCHIWMVQRHQPSYTWKQVPHERSPLLVNSVLCLKLPAVHHLSLMWWHLTVSSWWKPREDVPQTYWLRWLESNKKMRKRNFRWKAWLLIVCFHTVLNAAAEWALWQCVHLAGAGINKGNWLVCVCFIWLASELLLFPLRCAHDCYLWQRYTF